MRNILILHSYHTEYPPRATTREWLYSFRNYSGCRCFYVNLYFFNIPWYLHRIKWDLIVFTDLFVMERWTPPKYQKVLTRAQPIKEVKTRKILIPQDEFIFSNELCSLVNDFNIDHIFTCAEESDWKKIYATVDFTKVGFTTVLTGYLDEKTVDRIKKIENSAGDRSIDIGYRSKKVSPSLGRHGILKSKIAEIVKKTAPEYGLIIDISLDSKDTFLGDSWYRFLLQCKYFIGVEGGASILDRDGQFRKNVENYQKQHPSASFEEIESHCFPNEDGKIHLFAISPRHLEACATKTCQILIEGGYNGILTPGKHYIELKKDFSNLNHVLELVKTDSLRRIITETAYSDIVESGLYSYRSFVKTILDLSMDKPDPCLKSYCDPFSEFTFRYSRFVEHIEWMLIALNWILKKKVGIFVPKTILNHFTKKSI